MLGWHWFGWCWLVVVQWHSYAGGPLQFCCRGRSSLVLLGVVLRVPCCVCAHAHVRMCLALQLLPPSSRPTTHHLIARAEWNIIYDKLAKCADSGAKIVLSRYAIGDLATQYFADRDIFCAGRVSTWLALVGTHLAGGSMVLWVVHPHTQSVAWLHTTLQPWHHL